MLYDPFTRGPWAVGVRTIELTDRVTGARTSAEVWYPADARFRGHDQADDSRDRYLIAAHWPELRQDAVRNATPAVLPSAAPLVMFFHGGYGHRREATGLTTHLASHGYVVTAVDFPGDSVTDSFAASDAKDAAISRAPIDQSARNRPSQASGFIDGLLAAAAGLGLRVDATRIGSFGASMGGYTALALNSVDPRTIATFAICPMCGTRSPVPQIHRLRTLLRVDDWNRSVPTFLFTGAADPFVIADDVRELFDRLGAPKRLAIVEGVGHVHFADNAATVHEMMRGQYLSGTFPDPEIDAPALGAAMRPFVELLDETRGLDAMRSLLLAHMDATLKGDGEAAAFLQRDLEGLFRTRDTLVTLSSSSDRRTPSAGLPASDTTQVAAGRRA